ncbi:MAG: hypothetical protein VB144_04140 [Clostridia bacterium]|nr:hypothetical protein [Clostridia bacterium]
MAAEGGTVAIVLQIGNDIVCEVSTPESGPATTACYLALARTQRGPLARVDIRAAWGDTLVEQYSIRPLGTWGPLCPESQAGPMAVDIWIHQISASKRGQDKAKEVCRLASMDGTAVDSTGFGHARGSNGSAYELK